MEEKKEEKRKVINERKLTKDGKERCAKREVGERTKEAEDQKETAKKMIGGRGDGRRQRLVVS